MFTWYKRLAQTRPYWFVAVTILLFFLSGSVGVLLIVLFSDEAITASVPQIAGKMSGWLFCLLVLWRWQALKASGAAGAGGWRLWLLALVLAIYLAAAVTWSFFGEFIWRVPATAAAREQLFRGLGTGLIEEFTFRGVLFYGLMLAWGRGRAGLMKAAVVSAVAFGGLHLVYLAGEASTAVVLNALTGTLSGFWYAIMVWRFKSMWPPVLFHFLTNALVLANSPVTATLPNAYIMALLTELPLVFLALYWLREAPEEEALVRRTA